MDLKVFTSFSGYDSQCMALDRLGIGYDLAGWSEIDKYAIAAHNAVYPQYAERNYGDICNIKWSEVEKDKERVSIFINEISNNNPFEIYIPLQWLILILFVEFWMRF